MLSTPLDDVEDNVALIRRQTLIAGAIALLAALIAAYLAAGYHARRLRRLERAAERVARRRLQRADPGVGSRLADEVGQLAVTLDEMQRRLRGLDSARREFIANASHELRTPIASLGRLRRAARRRSRARPGDAAASSCGRCAGRSIG